MKMLSDNYIYNLTNQDINNKRKRDGSICAIIPIGSMEQHGDHLPVSTDSIIVNYLAEKIAKKIKAFYLPVINFGISFEHEPLFNISLTSRTFSKVICEVCISLAKAGVKDIILLNGHHGNMGALYYIAQDTRDMIQDDVKINFINYWNLIERFDHAGEIETSLVLAIDSKLVRMKYARQNTKELTKTKIVYSSITSTAGSIPKLTGSGVWGDPRKASVKTGKVILEGLTKKLTETIKEFKKTL